MDRETIKLCCLLLHEEYTEGKSYTSSIKIKNQDKGHKLWHVQ